jgi:acyl-CoA synthetase (NDP forming)
VGTVAGPAEGVETVIEVAQDPAFGAVLSFGLAGLATELLGDRTCRLVPLTDLDAWELVRELRGAPLLFGYRGRPPVDVVSLEELLLRVSLLADDLGEVESLRLEPVVVTPGGARVVDARARIAPVPGQAERGVRRLRAPRAGARPTAAGDPGGAR